jgi:hypothetical protein
MYTQLSVISRAVQAEVYAEGNRGPCRVLGTAVEADLVGLFPSQLFEECGRLGFGCHGHDGGVDWLIGQLAVLEDYLRDRQSRA